MKSGQYNFGFVSGVYERLYEGKRLGFVGVWEFGRKDCNRVLFVSLSKEGDEYTLGREMGYGMKKWILFDRCLDEITIYDLQERDFLFFDEILVYTDKKERARKALSMVEIERDRENI